VLHPLGDRRHDLGGNLHAQRSFAAGYTLVDSIDPVVYQNLTGRSQDCGR